MSVAVVFMAPVHIRKHVFCSVTSCFNVVFDAVRNSSKPYSILGLMSVLYIVSKVVLLAPHRCPVILFSRFIFFLVLSIMLLMCGFQVSCWSKVSPRNFAVLAVAIVFPLMSMLTCVFLAIRLLENMTAVVLVSFSLKPQRLHQLTISSTRGFKVFTSCCVFRPEVHIALSSAKRDVDILLLGVDGKSLMRRRKSIGEITLPCGVPFSSVWLSDRVLLIFTLIFRSERKSSIQFKIFQFIPYCFILYINPFFQSISKALLKSKNIAIVVPFVFIDLLMLSCRRIRWSRVERCFLYADWFGFIMLFFFQ
jgi:hypothetical protein